MSDQRMDGPMNPGDPKIPNLDCAEVLERLPLHVGGDLESGSAPAVAAHLEDCLDCQAAFERVESARTALVEDWTAEVRGGGPALWPGVRTQLVEEGLLQDGLSAPSSSGPSSSGGGGPRLAPVLPFRRAAGLVAAAAAVALLVTPFLTSNGDGASTPAVVDSSGPVLDSEPPAGSEMPLIADVADDDRNASEDPGVEPGLPRAGGLTPVRGVDELLRTQLGPGGDRVHSLTSSSSAR